MSFKQKMNNLLRVAFPPCGYAESTVHDYDYRDFEAEQRGREASRRLRGSETRLGRIRREALKARADGRCIHPDTILYLLNE
jgi:hypothetical protein